MSMNFTIPYPPSFSRNLETSDYSITLGNTIYLTNKITLGLVLDNINAPKIKETETHSLESIPPSISLGTEIKINPKLTSRITLLKRENKPIKTLFGTEIKFIQTQKTEFSLKAGIGIEKLTVGAGIKIDEFILDYAYQLTEKETDQSSQLLTITLFF